MDFVLKTERTLLYLGVDFNNHFGNSLEHLFTAESSRGGKKIISSEKCGFCCTHSVTAGAKNFACLSFVTTSEVITEVFSIHYSYGFKNHRDYMVLM